jgi:glycine/D-amino acid oxidase-like deaminating enzyme
MKILIAGAGIAGSVLARMLRERGHEVLVTDRQPHLAASRCAYAYVRTAWFKGEDKARVRESLDWYDEHGWIITREGLLHTRDGRVRTQGDHILVHPTAPLVKPEGSWGLSEYRDGPGGVLAALGPERVPADAHHLVLACGAGMDYWYTGRPVYGGVFECKDYTMIKPLKLLRITDRLTHVAADDGVITRTAASKGRTPAEAKSRSTLILNTMMDRGLITCTRRWTYRAGVRWESVDKQPVASRISTHVWALTGFARTGYAFAPSYARELIGKMEAG